MSIRSLFAAVMCLVLFSIFSAKAQGAMLTYSFDDGFLSVYESAFPILKSYGQVGTVNVVSNWVRWANHSGPQQTNRLNSTQLAEMEQAGWEICSHSKTHPHFSQIPQTYQDERIAGWEQVSGTSHTYKAAFSYGELPFLMEDSRTLKRESSIEEVEGDAGSYYFDPVNQLLYIHTSDGTSPRSHEIRADSVERELESSRNELSEMGLNITSFVVPFSDWSETREELAKRYYDSVGAGYHGAWVNNIPPLDRYWLARRPVHGQTHVDEVKGWIDEAIEKDQWLILLLHDIGQEGWPESDMETLAALIADKNIMVVTQREGLRLSQVPVPSSILLLFSGLFAFFACYLRRRSQSKCSVTVPSPQNYGP